MTKPSVFFSHSSKDGAVLSRLKDLIVENTGNSFDIFLSSDGQSIPLGRNWVYEIQEALESTSIVFVFISPNSLSSSWIYFEAGYAYSKKVRVIPIGIHGVTIESIAPPLGLLNGFQIQQHDDLNKILATINEVMAQRHKFRFSNSHFTDLFRTGNDSTSDEIRNLISDIECGWELSVTVPEDYKPLHNDDMLWFGKNGETFLLDRIETVAQQHDWQYSRQGSWLQLDGISIRVSNSRLPILVEVSAIGDSVVHDSTKWMLLQREGLGVSLEHQEFRLSLQSYLEFESDTNKASFMLRDSQIRMDPKGGYVFGDYKLRMIPSSISGPKAFQNPAALAVRPVKDKLDFSDIGELLEILLDRSVLKTR